MNVTLQCNDNTVLRATFVEITSCSCVKTTCTSSFNLGLSDAEGEDRGKSFFDAVNNIDQSPDKYQRRSMLDELAFMHAKKKKK